MRRNATIPQWDPITNQWIYRPYIDGIQKKYKSQKPGDKGAAECRKKYSAALAGQDKSNVRLSKAWEDHLADTADRLGADSESYRKAKSIGETHILPRLKNKRVPDITDQDWQYCISKAKPVRGGRAVLTKKTLKNIRGEITAFARYAKRAGMIDMRPDDLYIPKDAPTIGKQILQPDALRTLLTDDPGEWWYVHAWQLMAATGLRPGEVYGLKRDDVRDGMIKVNRSIRQDGKVTEGKNENAIRVMLQNEITAGIISKQIEQLNKADIGSGWLFSDPDGCKPNPTVIWHHWEEYRQRLPGRVTQYGLRHTFISMTKNNLPDALLKMLVGHSANMDTVGTYGHKVTGDDQQAAKIVEGVFNGILKKTSIIQVPGENENRQDATV